ncbi:MAG: hypothetical protein JXX14_00220 [Deltaproteobacteria bacterium]|nr:hypothetical protein [Deltaproteobacteria bacterium]
MTSHRTGFKPPDVHWAVTITAIIATVFAVAGCKDNSAKEKDVSEETDSRWENDSTSDLPNDDTGTPPGDSDSDSDSDSGAAISTGGQSCQPLSQPSGQSIRITPDDVGRLSTIVAGAQPGDVFIFESGTYSLNGDYIWISTPGVTLRSASGNPEDVILDGNYQTTEIVTVAASNCTIAEMTIQRAATHPIHVTTSEAGDTLNTKIYRMTIIDPGEQAIKINTHSSESATFADNGEVACSSIQLTDAGRPHVNMSATPCYTGGIDAHQARGWIIQDNTISGFWCPNGLAEHAVHFWRGCRDTVVERNILTNNARGVGFGMATEGDARTYSDTPCGLNATAYVGHVNGVIQNNFIHASDPDLLASEDGFDCGVCLWSACGVNVAHNTIVSTGALFSSIEWRFQSSSATVTNNLATHPMRERDGATATLAGNIDNASLSQFADAASGDLHLNTTAAAINAGITTASNLPKSDIDGDPRDATPDVGADEAL